MHKHERTPDSNMSTREIEIQQDIFSGEGSEGIEAIESFIAAKRALHEQIEEMMEGEGESTEEAEAYLNSFLIEAAQGFARTLQLAEVGLDDKLQFGAKLLLQSILEIKELSDNYACGISVDNNSDSTDEIIEAFEIQLAEATDKAEEFEAFEQTFGALHAHVIEVMVSHAPDNKNDLRRSRRIELRVKALSTAKETTKIALGASAAILAVRFLGKK